MFNRFVVLNGKRIETPDAAMDDILQKLHVAHKGIEEKKRRTRKIVYQPSIDKNVATKISSCEVSTQNLSGYKKKKC